MRKYLLKSLLARSDSFDDLALEVFEYQSKHNPVYRAFLKYTGRLGMPVFDLDELPFLPISLFKTHEIRTGKWTPETVFESSGTTGSIPSRHAVRSLRAYIGNAVRIFETFYGSLTNYHILALLPGYLERPNASLVAMVDAFIKRSRSPLSGFFLKDFPALRETVQRAANSDRRLLIIGVSFALLDFVQAMGPFHLPDAIVMETGGMKGRRRELIREELHERLRAGFGVPVVHSEYGMTELLSQAYAQEAGRFSPGLPMRVLIREYNDPFHMLAPGRTGLINIIDLANVDTCSFVATDDVGRLWPDGSFEVLGRYDHSDVRGCNLMVAS